MACRLASAVAQQPPAVNGQDERFAPLTAAARRAFWQTRRASTACACPPVRILSFRLWLCENGAHIRHVFAERERDGLAVVGELVGISAFALFQQIREHKRGGRAIGDKNDLLHALRLESADAAVVGELFPPAQVAPPKKYFAAAFSRAAEEWRLERLLSSVLLFPSHPSPFLSENENAAAGQAFRPVCVCMASCV